jgi:hypothetical protein
MEVMRKRLRAAEESAVPIHQLRRYSDYEVGMGQHGEAEQRIKIRTKDGFVCVSDKAYPHHHDHIRTAIRKMDGIASMDALGNFHPPHERVNIEYRTYRFSGICRQTGLRMFDEF